MTRRLILALLVAITLVLVFHSTTDDDCDTDLNCCMMWNDCGVD